MKWTPLISPVQYLFFTCLNCTLHTESDLHSPLLFSKTAAHFYSHVIVLYCTAHILLHTVHSHVYSFCHKNAIHGTQMRLVCVTRVSLVHVTASQ